MLTVTSVASESYDEYGMFSEATLSSGHIHVHEGGYIKNIVSESGQKVTVDGSVEKVSGVTVEETSKGYVADNNGTGSKGDASKNGYTISSLAELKLFRENVNNGGLEGVTVKLGADIDISSEGWKPIGNSAHPFYGTFDGNGHTIKGLTNSGYSISVEDIFTTSSSKTDGAAYGFFGVVGSKTINDAPVTIKNIAFTNAELDLTVGSNMCSVLIGGDVGAAKNRNNAYINSSYEGNITIANVSVSGTHVKSADTTGSIIGKTYTKGEVKVTGCIIDIDVYIKTSKKGAGIVGFASGPSKVYVKDNTMKGDVYLESINTSKNITGARCYINMTANTAAKFGKNFVFGNNVNTVTGKIYVGTSSPVEYLDPFTISYVFNNNGEATSAKYDYISVDDRENEKHYLDNNLVIFNDGAIVNGLYSNDGTNDNGKMARIDFYGEVTMNDCYVNGTYNAQDGSSVTLNNCYGHFATTVNTVANDKGTGVININGGEFDAYDSSKESPYLETAFGGSRGDNVFVLSGKTCEGYIMNHVLGSTRNYGYMSDSIRHFDNEGTRYTITKSTENGHTIWTVTNAPIPSI